MISKLLQHLSFLFHPFILMISTPIRMLQSLWEARLLFSDNGSDSRDKKRPRYFKFSADESFTHLFYWVMHDTLRAFGRDGTSPYIANGDFPVSTWFHQKTFSLFLYRYAPCLTVIFGTLFWVFSFGFWSMVSDPSWVIFGVVALFFSASTYYQMFVFQNYNILGWMFLPIALFCLAGGHYIALSICLSLMALSSITAVFMTGLITSVLFFTSLNFIYIAVFIPAGIISALPFLALIKKGLLIETLLAYLQNLGILKGGADQKNNRYKRRSNHLLTIVYGGLFSFFAIAHYFIHDAIAMWTMIALGIFFINQLLSRFADYQSVWITLTSCALTDFMIAPDLLLAGAFLLALNPINNRAITHFKGFKIYGLPLTYKPFPIQDALARIQKLLKPVPQDSRVMIAFDDPAGEYNRVYDGYSNLMETLSFLGQERKIHVFPDWHLVFMSGQHANFFGRTPDEVLKNAAQWDAGYAIIYQKSDRKLDNVWADHGFEILSSFDWRDMDDLYGAHGRFKNEDVPIFWLLKVPKI